MKTTTSRRAGQRAFLLIHLLVLISIITGLTLAPHRESSQDRTQSPRRPALRHQAR